MLDKTYLSIIIVHVDRLLTGAAAGLQRVLGALGRRRHRRQRRRQPLHLALQPLVLVVHLLWFVVFNDDEQLLLSSRSVSSELREFVCVTMQFSLSYTVQ